MKHYVIVNHHVDVTWLREQTEMDWRLYVLSDVYNRR